MRMIRNVGLDEISDGKLYEAKDIARTDCQGCHDCSLCCQGMGSSIVLDPFDIFRLTNYTGKDVQTMIGPHIELNVVDGLILPNLLMDKETERCSFLNQEGWCSIHKGRPGICRLFPMGRVYDETAFKYFLQVHECPKDKIKIRVKDWIDTSDLIRNERFINQWHDYMKQCRELLKQAQDDRVNKTLTMYLLNQFYIKKYDVNEDFYEQFDQRLADGNKVVYLLMDSIKN